MEVKQYNKQYHSDHSIVFSCQYHVVWCTKYRRGVIDDTVGARLKELVAEKQGEYGYELIEIEVMPDHVHILIDVDPRIGVVGIVGRIKGYTSHTLRKEFQHLKRWNLGALN